MNLTLPAFILSVWLLGVLYGLYLAERHNRDRSLYTIARDLLDHPQDATDAEVRAAISTHEDDR